MLLDDKYMYRCLELAKKGLGTTAPNPMVGAVLVYDNRIIGEGYTSPFGGNHAEVNCINSIKNNDLQFISKATLYVSLEPCSHFGKTPPCANLIVEKGIKNVVIGILDPNTLVSGNGVKFLEKNNCKVITDVLKHECKQINKRFFTFHNKKRPYIILKWAESKDGFIGKLKKEKAKPIWISNLLSQQLVHKWRSEEQAILIGTNTAISDNPSLTVRKVTGKNPIRIIIDKNLRIPFNYNVLDNSIKTIVLTERTAKNTKNIFYEQFNFQENIVKQLLEVLYQYQIQSVFIEGGKQTLQTFIDTNLWDEARVFIGNSILNSGVKAPILKNEKLESSTTISSDILNYYINNSKTKTIKNLLFDFGDVFINLDKTATLRELHKLGATEITQEMDEMNKKYEKGLVTTCEFVAFYQNIFPNTTEQVLKESWNAILLDFPEYRLKFLEKLAKKYPIYLLSNINDLHLSKIKKNLGKKFYNRFLACFKKVYYSHEINLRKPDNSIFEYVLKDANIIASETIFVDDTLENIEKANELGFKTWHINPAIDDIINLSLKFDLQ